MITFNQYFINVYKNDSKVESDKPIFESDNWQVFRSTCYQDFIKHFELDETNYNIRVEKGKIYILVNKNDINKNCWLFYINQGKMFLKDCYNQRLELSGFKISNPELQPFLDIVDNFKDK